METIIEADIILERRIGERGSACVFPRSFQSHADFTGKTCSHYCKHKAAPMTQDRGTPMHSDSVISNLFTPDRTVVISTGRKWLQIVSKDNAETTVNVSESLLW